MSPPNSRVNKCPTIICIFIDLIATNTQFMRLNRLKGSKILQTLCVPITKKLERT